MPSAEILSQGDEVVTGQTVDTNAAWLAARLTDLGFVVRGHTTVGDHLPDIRAAVEPQPTLAEQGVASEAAVVALAQRVREQAGAGLGLALNLNADPRTEQAGSGMVALCGEDLRAARAFRVAGGADLIRTLGAGAAIDFLRRRLQDGALSDLEPE